MSAIRNVGLLFSLVGLAACGGGAGLTAPGGAEPQVVRQPVGALEGASAMSLRLDRAGTVEVTADWGAAANDVDVYVTGADCFDIPTALSVWHCLTVAEATGAASKPERLSFDAAAGSYKVLVLNRGSQPDTVTLTVSIR